MMAFFFFKSSDRLDDTRSPQEGEIKTAAMSQARNGPGIIFRWVILGHKISDWSIHPVFPFRLNEEHVAGRQFFFLYSSLASIFPPVFALVGVLLISFACFFGRHPLNLHRLFSIVENRFGVVVSNFLFELDSY